MARSTKYRGLAVANQMKEESRWRAESDLRTLTEAEAIKKDEKRMEAVRGILAEKKSELQAVAYELSDADAD